MKIGYSGFSVGDKVWIDRTEYVETVEMIRNPQTIEGITPIPVINKGKSITTFMIDIVGSAFIYGETDLRHYEGDSKCLILQKELLTIK